ncbi:MAG TPA: ribonuclease HII, partial [Gemmatimonadetes bacterium]|nr:ribonuclease HII [Gemmatimonadota bacterium]
RDRLMVRLSERYPEYGWERNKGYGTSEHRNAIERHGLTPHHRLTFGGLQYDLEL